MSVALPSVLAALALSAVHVLAPVAATENRISRRNWLSLAGGISAGYVFVVLLPELAVRQAALSVRELRLMAEREIFLSALAGMAACYWLEHLARRAGNGSAGWQGRQVDPGLRIHAVAFASYSALTGYLLIGKGGEGTLELIAFTFAFALHFFVNDQFLRRFHGAAHDRWLRWGLAGAVLTGFTLGLAYPVSHTLESHAYAFVAGAMILNIFKEELPEERRGNVGLFVLGAVGISSLGLIL